MLEGDFACSTHWKWRSSAATQINDDIHFAWQAQYLVMLEGDFTCIHAGWKWRLHMCRRRSLRDIHWEIAGAQNVVFYNTKSSPRCGPVKVSVTGAAGAWWRFYRRDILGLCSNCSSNYTIRNRLSKLGRVRSSEAELALKSGAFRYRRIRRTDYGEVAGSTRYLLPRMAEMTFQGYVRADHWWHSRFCVAGAVFADVGGWLDWLHALEMTFLSCDAESMMTLILSDRCSICVIAGAWL